MTEIPKTVDTSLAYIFLFVKFLSEILSIVIIDLHDISYALLRTKKVIV
jgi:hypothetical protein